MCIRDRCNVVSRRGDVLVPRLTVYYDGAITKEELYDNIDTALIEDVYKRQSEYSQLGSWYVYFSDGFFNGFKCSSLMVRAVAAF